MDFDQGYEVAENWAAHSASAAKLERMKAFLDRLNAMAPQERDDWFRVRGNHKPWVELVRIIEGNRNLPVVPYVNEFWRALLGDLFSEASSSKFLRGFVEGAVDLWAKVQPQL